MKVTFRLIDSAARKANVGVLTGYPFGLRVEPSGTMYRLSLRYRKDSTADTLLVAGSPREVMAAITAVTAFAVAAKETHSRKDLP